MSDRKRFKVYAATGLGSEVVAVALALTANLTRDFDGPLQDLSTLFGGAGLVALGAVLELWRGRRNGG